MKLIWECILTVHLLSQLFPWQKHPLTQGKNQKTRIHIHQTQSYADPFSFFLPLSLTHSRFLSHIFLDCGFSTRENTDCCHRDGHESWQGQALAEKPPSDKPHRLAERRKRSGRKTGRQTDRQVRGGGKGDESSKWKQTDWHCLNCGVICAPGSRVSSLQRGDQNEFKLRQEGRGWDEGKGATEIEPKAGSAEKGESCFFFLTSLRPRGEKCISGMAEKSCGGHSSIFPKQHMHNAAITGRQPQQDNSINRFELYPPHQRKQVVIVPQSPINHQNMQNCVI